MFGAREIRSHQVGGRNFDDVSQPSISVVLQITIASEASLGGLMNGLMGTRFAAPENQKSNWTDSFCTARVIDGLAYANGRLGDRDYPVGNGLPWQASPSSLFWACGRAP